MDLILVSWIHIRWQGHVRIIRRRIILLHFLMILVFFVSKLCVNLNCWHSPLNTMKLLLEKLEPCGESIMDSFLSMLNIEFGSHCLQQVFIIMQIFFAFDLIKFENIPDIFITHQLIVCSQMNEHVGEQVV